MTDRVEDQSAEPQGQYQIVELVPVEPIGRWCSVKQWTDDPFLPFTHRDRHRIGSSVLHFDALAVPDHMLMPGLFRLPGPPGSLSIFHITGIRRKLGNDLQSGRICGRCRAEQYFIPGIRAVRWTGGPEHCQALSPIIRCIDYLQIGGNGESGLSEYS